MEDSAFLAAAKQRPGYKPRVFYDLHEAASLIGVPYETLNKETNAGRLEYHLPRGRKQGKLVRPEWVDKWIEEGTHERF